MRPLTKEQLFQEAEQAWRLYFDNNKPLPSPMSMFVDGYVTCYAKCLGRQHDELIGMLKDFTISQEPKQIEPKFKVGDEIQDGCNAFIVIEVELDRQRYKTTYKCMAGTDAGISAPHYITFKEQSKFTLVKHAPKYHVGQSVKWAGGIFPVRSINETNGSYFYYIGAMDSYVDEGQLSPVTESDIKGLAVE